MTKWSRCLIASARASTRSRKLCSSARRSTRSTPTASPASPNRRQYRSTDRPRLLPTRRGFDVAGAGLLVGEDHGYRRFLVQGAGHGRPDAGAAEADPPVSVDVVGLEPAQYCYLLPPLIVGCATGEVAAAEDSALGRGLASANPAAPGDNPRVEPTFPMRL